MLNNLRTVNYWHDKPYAGMDAHNCLKRAFEGGTGEGSNPISYFFSDIWIPILTRDSNHKPVVGTDGNFVVTYTNVGLTTEQLADAYWTEYSRNMLVQPLTEATEETDVPLLAKRIKSVLLLNKYKYLKWIDTMGYAYNPLWNVDGSESYQYIDKHGIITNTNTPILPSTVENQITTYDSTSYRNDNKQVDTFNGTQAINTEDFGNILGAGASITGPLTPIVGGDYSHIEKRIRQGNIGVTETTALLTHERELVRFNLIQEFFNDINKQILIGIYCMKG